MSGVKRDLDYASAARALVEVTRALAAGHDTDHVLQLVVTRVRALLHGQLCFVIRLSTDQRVRMVAEAGVRSHFRELVPRHDREGLVMMAMADRQPIWSADVLDDPAVVLSPASRGFIEGEGYRAALALPLLVDTRVVGALLIGRAEVGVWRAEEIELAHGFADHAAMALERARLSSVEAARAEFDEALVDVERQLLAELSIDRLLPLIVERAQRLTNAQGTLYFAEPEERRLRPAWTGLTESFGTRPFGSGVIGVCAETRRGLMVNDYASWPDAYQPVVAAGARRLMAQPLLSRGRLLGVIAMGRGESTEPFEDRDLILLQRFATHAALALNNAMLYSEADQRRRGAEALAAMARVLSETPDLATVGRQVVDHVKGFFDLDCTVRLSRGDGGLVAIASTYVTPGHVQAAGTGLTARVMAGGRAAATQDLGAEPGLTLDDDLRGRVGHRGALIVPLRAERRIVGALQIVGSSPRQFSDLEIELAQGFADQAAPALEGARLQADLRSSEERTRLIIDTALDAVVTIDVEGRIIGWNAQAERTFGWSREEAIGRILSETIIPPRYREAHEAGLRRYRASGEGAVVNRRLELAALHRDGREFPVELSITPVATREMTTFSAFLRDITQRVEAEHALRRQTALVRLLQMVAVAANEAPTAREALQIGVDQVCAFTGWPVGDAFVLAPDESGHLVPARVWHLDEPERHRRFLDLSERTRFARGVGLPGRVLATGKAVWIIDVTKDPNFPRASIAAELGVKCAFGFPVLAGSEVVAVLEFFTSEPREPDAALLDAMANIGTQLGRVFERQRSESVLREAKEAAEAASRAKSSFLANMSHELRTPMNAILGYAQVLGRDVELGAEHRRAVGVIESSGEHLLSLINEVLDIAKIEAGTIEVQNAPFDLAALVADVVDIMRRRAEDKGLGFTYEGPVALPPTVESDDKRLRQVLMNLLDNAIKYTPRGSVALGISRHDDRYRFSVEDTGVGIGAEDLPRIFETFHQVRTPQQFIEGTGLGLPISKTLVTLMGGALEVQSTPGAGSRFWFELDLPEVAAARASTRDARRIVAVRGARTKLLVVDDKADNRQLLRDLLAPFGFAVDEAADGEACLAHVRATPPDAVLLDLRMPGLSGLEVLQRLRAFDAGRRAVVIAVSASVFGHHRDECIAAGADDFLAKPFRVERLLDVLCQHLGLERVYAEAEEDRPADLVFPPRDVLAQLLEQARRGDIKQLLERAARVEASDGRYRPFVKALQGLAGQFQVKRLCQFLEEGRP